MYKIKTGDADLITLDAADVYFAGKLVFTFHLAFHYINSMTSFHEKSQGSFISNWIGMKFGRIVLQVHMHKYASIG